MQKTVSDIHNFKFFVFILILFVAGNCTTNEEAKKQLPNIIYILADDLGYGELGVYGQEKIETPNIDALANSGMKFTEHYAGSAVCAPSRYMLMTGKHPGNAYIRGNDELSERGDIWSFEAMYDNPELEGQRPIPDKTVTVAKLLQSAGYNTGAIGKWGLGGPCTTGHPNEQGFDLFYGYLCQRQAHTYYPTHLWKNKQRVYLDNDLVPPHQSLPEGMDPYEWSSYEKFQQQPDYSAELMHIEALKFIEENQDEPFFLYLPTPIPHVPLQAPEPWINYYLNKFGEEEPYPGGNYTPVRYPNATYAALISYMDEQVGELIEKLKSLDLYDNTLIIFTSDNGPTFTGGVDPEYFDSADPFKGSYGWGKGYLHEGGIRVPMIASWNGKIPQGTISDHISAQWDIMPTFGEIAGVETPADIDGISFLPTLLGEENEQEQHEFLYWEIPEYGGQQAVRIGKWKGIRKNMISEGNLNIELFDLEKDKKEEDNIADKHPEIVEKIRLIMNSNRTEPEVDTFRIPVIDD